MQWGNLQALNKIDKYRLIMRRQERLLTEFVIKSECAI